MRACGVPKWLKMVKSHIFGLNFVLERELRVGLPVRLGNKKVNCHRFSPISEVTRAEF
jgi:hypothetical protein